MKIKINFRVVTYVMFFIFLLLITNTKILADKQCDYIGRENITVNISSSGGVKVYTKSRNNCNSESFGGETRCADGYYDETAKEWYPGVLNWSEVDSKKSDFGAKDAYAVYESTSECPGYIYEIENGKNRYYFLSAGTNAASLNNIKTASEKAKSKLGGKNYMYYNQDDSTSIAVSSDLTCEYENTEDSSIEMTIEIKQSGEISGKIDNAAVVINNKMYSKAYQKMLEKDKCPKHIDTCYFGYKDVLSFFKRFTPLATLPDKIYNIIGDNSVNQMYCSIDNMDAEAKIKGFNCTGDNCSSVDVCQMYDDYEKILENDLAEYNSQKNSKSKGRKELKNYNTDKNIFNEYCKSALKTINYVDGSCLENCLRLSKDLARLETDAGLRSGPEAIKCNIGESVLNLVYNVLKWGKYIAPVLVIILSILDFIKAIASQNDDDMKKAQGKFIKRLIIAAILFLLPLIINFMLKTFGLYSSKCDITDLFG